MKGEEASKGKMRRGEGRDTKEEEVVDKWSLSLRQTAEIKDQR